LSGKVKVTLGILADDGLLVVAGHVVPFDPVAVEVVQDGQAGLVLASLLVFFPVIGLTTRGIESSGERPVMESSAVGRVQPGLIGGPKPSVDFFGEEVGSVTPVKVTKATRGPNVLDSLHFLLNPLVFVLGLETDEVHAPLAAVVTGVEPVPVGGPDSGVVGPPGEQVVVASVVFNSSIIQPVLTKDSVRKAQFSRSFVRISSAILRERNPFP